MNEKIHQSWLLEPHLKMKDVERFVKLYFRLGFKHEQKIGFLFFPLALILCRVFFFKPIDYKVI